MTDTIRKWYEGGPQQTSFNMEHFVEQLYDGNGAIVKRHEKKTMEQVFPQQEHITERLEYFVRSTVFGGRTLTELDADGAKKVTNVYTGSGILAELSSFKGRNEESIEMKAGEGLYCVAAMVVLLIFAQASFAQNTADANLSDLDKAYENVVERLFPRDEVLERVSGYGLVVRFTPSFEGESQINIQYADGKAEIIEFRSADGSIYAKLDDIFSHGRAAGNLDDLARMMPVKRRQLSQPVTTVRGWRDSFLKAAAYSAERSIARTDSSLDEINQVHDGTTYEIWYRENADSERYYKFSGSGQDGKPLDEDALIKWAKELHEKVIRLK